MKIYINAGHPNGRELLELCGCTLFIEYEANCNRDIPYIMNKANLTKTTVPPRIESYYNCKGIASIPFILGLDSILIAMDSYECNDANSMVMDDYLRDKFERGDKLFYNEKLVKAYKDDKLSGYKIYAHGRYYKMIEDEEYGV